jgi:hypothetical protein
MAQLSSGFGGPARQWAVPLLLLLAEAVQFTFYRNQLGDYASPIVLYLTSVALCFATGRAVRHQAWPPQLAAAGSGRQQWWPAALALAVGLALCFPALKKAIQGTLPQDHSDIIPAITVYCQRLLAGEVVHRPLTEDIGYFLEPGYLPATWFPFVVPEFFRFDYRWMSSSVLLLGLLAYLVVVVRLRRPAAVTFGLGVLPLLFTYALVRPDVHIFNYTVLHTDAQIFTITLEPLIAGYYLLLMAAVLLPSRPLVVIMLILCLLSRFSLLFWVPLYLGLLYTQESRRLAWATAGLVLAGIVALYVVPVLSHDWGLFMRVQEVYTQTALGEWNHLYNGQPMHLYNGLGLTNLIFHYGPADVLERLKLAKQVHLAAIISVVVATALYYWRQRRPRTNYRVFAIIVLKLYLATFYALLQVPYSYLAVVGFFASFYLLVVAVGPAAETITAPAGPLTPSSPDVA